MATTNQNSYKYTKFLERKRNQNTIIRLQDKDSEKRIEKLKKQIGNKQQMAYIQPQQSLLMPIIIKK